ncbi:anaphase-promoting complex substrate recognition subunit Apc10 [Schizosaccharomyces pombe]|uniref:Anaphase-promoting complex subunit 10 n=1 Tax=Schizosaccharomyces pombe (strain 972 / ATCC 24843) TaxID=284812 RepID=APC10_SCHPO|nr:anaphase-promoting complex subunit Apc10 [Schizosaccharomyces pombe]O42971.1 RecName: Full=Anaphase-promoting complex subunit 10; AltName: Full=20S cyclosome/APC complex protein apc10 [Schizosaccharomyces pombe 972h-]BAA32157.1 Apc10 (anaphase promoting complex) [Schizosaccharomyces pombe]CAA16839.1 anaphase-promoting complex subunit Apc10 [Schizosaccharomyces pombe]|eukprot:NP_595803.1 anaphase-promoting complex subunit Apc10 [Schizosaccharomyces pombe]
MAQIRQEALKKQKSETQKSTEGFVDIGNLAQWTCSSEKSGFPIRLVRDDNIDTYWQSDGSQPHTIHIKFVKRVSIKYVSMYLQYTLDESYTPSTLRISAGTGFQDLEIVTTVQVEEPTGWVHVPVGDFGRNGLLDVHLIQIKILANHQSGKDSHVRLIKIYAPEIEQPAIAVDEIPYTSLQFISRNQLR